MKRLYRVVIGVIVFYILLFGIATVLCNQSERKTQDNHYKIELNRIQADLKADVLLLDTSALKPAFFEYNGSKEQPENLFSQQIITNAKKYQSIISIAYLSSNATKEETEAFYAPKEESTNIYQYRDRTGQPVFIRVGYQNDYTQDHFKYILYGILAVTLLAILAVLFYVQRWILRPFHNMSEMPEKLAKGHLTEPLKQTKNRYFHKFLWGLDLLREKLEEEKQKNWSLEREKKLLLLSISHDMFTPLSSIKMASKALYEDLYTDCDKKKELAHQIEKNAICIEKQVGDIVKASKEDFLQFEIKVEEVYLRDIIDQIQHFYQEKLSLLYTKFIIHPYTNRLLKVDTERLIEVLQNIIENAIKYGDGKEISIEFDKEEGYQILRINNSGCSLPEKELVHIFDSFYRGTNIGSQKGSGLGLYICKQILHKMEGDIYATIQGNMMRVTVVIPLA